jgi:hypothetical protein
VRDKNGQAIAYVYYGHSAGRRRPDAKLLTKDEARRIAAISPREIDTETDVMLPVWLLAFLLGFTLCIAVDLTLRLL